MSWEFQRVPSGWYECESIKGRDGYGVCDLAHGSVVLIHTTELVIELIVH